MNYIVEDCLYITKKSAWCVCFWIAIENIESFPIKQGDLVNDMEAIDVHVSKRSGVIETGKRCVSILVNQPIEIGQSIEHKSKRT